MYIAPTFELNTENNCDEFHRKLKEFRQSKEVELILYKERMSLYNLGASYDSCMFAFDEKSKILRLYCEE